MRTHMPVCPLVPLILNGVLVIVICAAVAEMAPTKHQGMAKSKVLQAKPVVAKPHKLLATHMDLQEPVECPLCIEQLDDTDRHFYPCPCGYQVCLFCYQRLQKEYNNTCPGCRQQYSDDLDAVRQRVERKQQQQAAETPARPVVSCGSNHTGHGHAPHGHLHGHTGAHGQHHAGHGHAVHAGHPGYGHVSHRPKQPVPPPPTVAKQRQQHEPGHSHPRPGELHNSGLPASANWVNAAAAGGNLSSVDSTDTLPLTTADEESWPTLGVAATASNQQQQQQHHHQQHKHQPVRRQSSSSSLSSMQSQQQPHQQLDVSTARQDLSRSSCDSSVSTATGHVSQQGSQQQEQPQQQQLESRSSSGFTSVEVTTVVGGARHSVCVPVSSHSDVSPFPEAATLLDMLQQAVNGNKLSSTEAAVQLVQCLRKLEADSSQKQQRAWLDQALASGKSGGARNGTPAMGAKSAAANGRPPAGPTRAPPPGFGNHPRAAGGVYAPQLQQQQQEQAAAARGMPYRPSSSGQQQLLGLHSDNNYASQSSMQSVDSESSLFSQGSGMSQSGGLWTDSGLPGLDFGAGVAGLSSGLSSGLAAVPPGLQMLWASSSGAGHQGSGSAAAAAGSSGYASPSVPPGFGGTAGLGLASRISNGSTSRLLNGSYNPLSYADLGTKSNQQSGLAAPPGFGGMRAGATDAAQKQEQSIYRPWS